MAFTATPEPDNQPPRVRLDLTGGTDGPVPVVRTNPDGTTTLVQEPVTVNGGTGTVFDYLAPFGGALSYTDTVTGQVTGQVTLDVSTVWLINPFRPMASMPISVDSSRAASFGAATWAKRTHRTSRTLVRLPYRRRPIVVTGGGRQAPSSTLVVRTYTLDELDRLMDLTGDDSSLLLNVPDSLGLGVGSSWISVDDLDEDRRDTHGADPYRSWVMPYDTVDAPFGRPVSLWSWETLEESFATLDDADAAFATWEDQETGVRRA